MYVTTAPGTTLPGPLTVTLTSALGETTALDVALLFPDGGSLTPLGGAIVAVFDSVPVAFADSVPVTVNVTEPPAARSTLSARSPLPLAAHAEPGDAAQVHVAPVSATGSTSVTVAPVTALGPALLAVIVYVAARPGTGGPELSTFVMLRSAVGVIAVLSSVALLFAGDGSVTPPGAVIVAVLLIVPQ